LWGKNPPQQPKKKKKPTPNKRKIKVLGPQPEKISEIEMVLKLNLRRVNHFGGVGIYYKGEHFLYVERKRPRRFRRQGLEVSKRRVSKRKGLVGGRLKGRWGRKNNDTGARRLDEQ